MTGHLPRQEAKAIFRHVQSNQLPVRVLIQDLDCFFITFALEHLITKWIRNCSIIKEPISISLDIQVFDSNTYEKPH